MSIRRITVLAASAALLLAVLGTIRGSHTPPIQNSVDGPTSMVDPYKISSAESMVELHVEVSMPHESFRVLQALNRSFMDRHKDIVVRLHNLESDSLYDVLGRAFRLGDTSDIMLLHNEKIMQYAVMAHLYPADDFYTSDTETEYLSAMTEQLRWNGYIWGVPFQIQPYILAYHEQAWLENTGSAQPESAEQIFDAYREGKLFIEEEDLLAYAAFAYLLDPEWQTPNMSRWTETDEEIEVDGEEDVDAEENVDIEEDADQEENGGTEEDVDQEENGGTDEVVETVKNVDAESEPTERSVQVHSATGFEETDSSNSDESSPLADTGDHLISNEQGEHLHLWSESDEEDQDPWDRLASGEIMLMIAPLHEFEKNQRRGISAVSIPLGDGQVFVSGQSFVLASEVEHHEAAFRWIREMTDSYNQIFMERSLGAYPANRTAYEYQTGPQLYFRLLRRAVADGRTMQSDLLVEDKLATFRELLREPLPDEEIITLMEMLKLLYQRFEEAGLITH